MYRQLVDKSTVLKDELSLAEALDAVQMGLAPEVIDVIMTRSLIKERAKFRLALLRKIYPSLHEHALAEKLALEHERARLEKALTELKGGSARR
jgi:replication initiation and membrane attachment protein DnaB